MGSIALLALAMLIQLGLRLNYQQQEEQNTFRHALLMAKCEGDEMDEPIVECVRRAERVNDDDESQAVTINRFHDRQIPNPTLGFGLRPRTTITANAAAVWGERLTFLDDDRDSQPRIVVHLNREQPHYRSEDLEDARLSDPSQDCPFDLKDCLDDCADEDDIADCRTDCRDTWEGQCFTLPLVDTLEKTLTVEEAELTQSGGVTSVSSEVTETTRLRLNTTQDRNVESTLTSTCNAGGGFWLCD